MLGILFSLFSLPLNAGVVVVRVATNDVRPGLLVNAFLAGVLFCVFVAELKENVR